MSARAVFSAAMLSVGIIGVGAMSTGVAQASLIGATVGCSVSGGFLQCAPSSFALTADPFTPNPDTVIEQITSGADLLNVDFMGGWVDITNAPGSVLDFGIVTSQIVSFTGLVDQHAPTLPVNLRGLSITDVTGLDASDFSLIGSTLTIDLTGSVWGANGAVGFDVAVPLPASALLLLGGLAGLGLVGRRKSQA